MTNDKGILIRNVYYMLSYAFQELKKNNYEHIAKEEFEHVLDLLAEILYRGISEQLKKGLYREYINKKETLPTLRGHLDITGTIHNKIQRKHKLDCEYDELSENNTLNSIIKSTMMLLISNHLLNSKQKKQLRSILPYFCNVSLLNISYMQWNTLHFHKNNHSYCMLINICHLIVDGVLMTTKAGNIHMPTFSEEQMHKLFERFVLNYYKREHPSLRANSDSISWDIDSYDSIGLEFLPSMRSDITLHKDFHTLIIDTKYYGHVLQSQFNKKTVHSNNLYQIFSYVKNTDKEHTGNVSGLLLYARTEEKISPNIDTSIGGNRIMVRTLDLNQEFHVIKKQLDDIVTQVFDKEPSKSYV